jgi:hypothetical protein
VSDISTSIHDFIGDVFTPATQININKAISLLEAFEHQNAYGEMMDAITDESISDLHARGDHFIVALIKQLDFMLCVHFILLTPEATLRHRIDILDALYRIQHLEDYTEIVAILSMEESIMDMEALILASLTEHDEAYFLDVFQEIHPQALVKLAEFVDRKLDNQPGDKTDLVLLARLQMFSKALGNEHIAYMLMEAGMLIGLPVPLYLKFIQDYLVEKDNRQHTALNMLSILYMSDTPEDQMLTAYRDMASFVIEDLAEVSRVETFVIQHLARISDIRKVTNEQAGLSQESPAS